LEEEEEIVPEDVDVDDRVCCGKGPAAADVADAAACSPDVDVMKPFCGVNWSSGKNKLDRLSVASIFSLVLWKTNVKLCLGCLKWFVLCKGGACQNEATFMCYHLGSFLGNASLNIMN
jgi:hypothetical protein